MNSLTFAEIFDVSVMSINLCQAAEVVHSHMREKKVKIMPPDKGSFLLIP